MNLTEHRGALGGRNLIGVEKQLLRPQREIINRAQQRTIVENSRTNSDHCLTGFEWIVGEREPRPEIVPVTYDAFVLPTQTVTDQQIRNDSPIILREQT